MYKVLIADDESIICRGIAGMVSQHPQLEVVALAEDGEIAIDKATETLPDLLFVDINMPFLNGLEFIEKIREILPEVLIVVISGYDDFSYVQKALQLGVADYMLKPIMEEDFMKLLDVMVSRLDGMDKSRKYLNWMEEQMEQNRPSMLNDFFYNWVSNRLDETEKEKQMQYLNIQIPSDYWFTLIYFYKEYDKDNLAHSVEGMNDPLRTECCSIVKKCFEPYSEVVCFRTDDGALAVISNVFSREKWEELIVQIKTMIEKCMHVKIVVNQQQGSSIAEFTDIYYRMREEYNNRKQYSKPVENAIDAINRQWGESELSLQSVADSLYVSAPYLSRLFSKETGENFASYLTRKRINEAMWLLKNTDLKMYEIARKTGYASQHYFSNIFKKVVGISPADYRKEVLK